MQNIIIINGMWSNAKNSEVLSLELSDFNVFTYQRDYDKTSSLRLLLDDIKEQFKGVENPVLIGHSMGGFLALKLVEEGFSKKVIAIAPALSGNFNQVNPLKLKALYLAFISKKMLISKKDAAHLITSDLELSLKNKIYSSLVPEHSSIIRSFAFRSPITWIKAKKFKKVSVLMMAGKKDLICPAEGVEKMANLLGADYLVYDSAHYPFLSFKTKQSAISDIKSFIYWGHHGKK